MLCDGAKPPFFIMEGFFKRIWGQYLLVIVVAIKDGMFMVRFEPMEDQILICRGTYFFNNEPAIVKAWAVDSKANRLKVPIESPLPEAIDFVNENEILMQQDVHDERKPVKCSSCQWSNHKEKSYKRKRHRFLITFIYGHNNEDLRKGMRNQLRCSTNSINKHRCVIGDSNFILSAQDKLGGLSIEFHEIKDFKCCLMNCYLHEMRIFEAFSSWPNRQEVGDKVHSKIDRAICNVDWANQFEEIVRSNIPFLDFITHGPRTLSLMTLSQKLWRNLITDLIYFSLFLYSDSCNST
ncbi:hypothetical protein Cgig2_008299 [Carnegiea gigantea]|uniref:Uncharacterized protein n=1 Tax=Carnegiea gigantea TaxID=171969 RepID=A0A9Q1GUX6_9CARY|nr:hypothetical protein Cgig2_008299 [Carnegiea gigantea]